MLYNSTPRYICVNSFLTQVMHLAAVINFKRIEGADNGDKVKYGSLKMCKLDF